MLGKSFLVSKILGLIMLQIDFSCERQLFTPRFLLSVSLGHNMEIQIFSEIAYIGQHGCISSWLSGLRHYLVNLRSWVKIPWRRLFKVTEMIFWKSYFYQRVICHLLFGHSYLLYVTSFFIYQTISSWFEKLMNHLKSKSYEKS